MTDTTHSRLADRLGPGDLEAIAGVIKGYKAALAETASDGDCPQLFLDLAETVTGTAQEALDRIVGYVNEEIDARQS